MNTKRAAAALIAASLALAACAHRPSGDLATFDMPGGLVTHIEHHGSGDPSTAYDRVVLHVDIQGATTGHIAQLSGRSRTIDLNDPNLIKGLQVALPGIRTGERRRIEIPWPLAYGDEGRAPIPPREDLVVTVTCTAIIPPEEDAP